MTGATLEGKTLQIKDESEVKDILRDQSVKTLNTNNSNEFTKIHDNYLVSNGVNILDSDTSEIIRYDDGSFLIAQKNADNTLSPLVKIADKKLMEDFLTHVVQYELGANYRDAIVHITQLNEKREVSISYRKEIADLKGEIIPTVEEIGAKLQGVEAQYNTITKDLLQFLGKKYADRQFRLNTEIIQTIVNEQHNHILFINDYWKRAVGYDGLKDKFKLDKSKFDWKDYDSVLIRHNTELMEIHRQFRKILMYSGDYEKLKGRTDLGESGIDIYTLGINELKDFSKLLQMTLDIDKKKTEEMMTVAMLKLEDEDFRNLYNHLKGVAEKKIDPTTEPFVPQNMAKVQALVDQYPELKNYVLLDKTKEYKEGKNGGDTEFVGGMGGGTGLGNSKNIEGITNSDAKDTEGMTTKQKEEYNTLKEAFAKGGIGGTLEYGLDKTNMEPEQKETWKGIGRVALTAGTIFVGFKMIQSAWRMLFNKEQRKGDKLQKNLTWLLGPAAILFTTQAVAGESPMAIFKGGKLTTMMAGLFGGKKGKESTSNAPTETKESLTYVTGFTGVSALFHSMKYGDIDQFLEEDSKGKIKIKADQYDLMLQSYKDNNNLVAAKFLEYIGKDDKKHIMDLALDGMGISLAELQSNPEKLFDEKIAGTAARIANLYAFMEDNHYDKINTDTLHLVTDYFGSDKNESYLEDLEKRGDVFEKDEVIGDKAGLKAKIESITNGDAEKTEELLKAINRFYEQWPTADLNKKIDLIPGLPYPKLQTYGQVTEINIGDKKMTGLDANFDGYLELFKAANLTNYIKKLTKGKTAQSPKPFGITPIGGDIKFDDAELLSWKFDTEIISGGRGGALQDISPTLEEKKESYVEYLNKII